MMMKEREKEREREREREREKQPNERENRREVQEPHLRQAAGIPLCGDTAPHLYPTLFQPLGARARRMALILPLWSLFFCLRAALRYSTVCPSGVNRNSTSSTKPSSLSNSA